MSLEEVRNQNGDETTQSVVIEAAPSPESTADETKPAKTTRPRAAAKAPAKPRAKRITKKEKEDLEAAQAADSSNSSNGAAPSAPENAPQYSAPAQTQLELSSAPSPAPENRGESASAPAFQTSEPLLPPAPPPPSAPAGTFPIPPSMTENLSPETRENADGRDNRNPEGGRNALRFRGGRAQLRRDNNRNDNRDNRNDNRGDRDNNRNDNRDNRNENRRDRNNRQNNGQDGNRRRDHDFAALEAMEETQLREVAGELGVELPETFEEDFDKTPLFFEILKAQASAAGNQIKKGTLEILGDGKGFMRCDGYLSGDADVYVSQSQIKRFNLKTGDYVTGLTRTPKESERYYGLLRVEAINDQAPENFQSRKEFEKQTPIFPDEKFDLETDQYNITARVIDLVSPIGFGQRGLIVAPPKAGKTSLIKNIANSIAANHPDVKLIILLIDERPEEVTDISRSVRGEVVASTFDETPENHIRVSDMVLEKAKRMVEMKHDVVILLDSITRLSRASNLVVQPSGRTMSGGLDPAAMYKPKRLFGAARNIEEGGSLTILATVLVDTGSRMDEYIFEELKGTGNMDLVLDRDLFNQRIFPAIDINKSGTRRDDLLLSKEDLAATIHLRRTLSALDNDKAITLLIDRLKNTKTNGDFMQIVAKSRNQQGQGN